MSKYEYDEFDEYDIDDEAIDYIKSKNECNINYVKDEMLDRLDEWCIDKKINEIKFSEIYTNITFLKCIDDSLYNINGYISENELKSNIQYIISEVITSRVNATVNSIYGTLKNHCFTLKYEPQKNKIHLKNGTITINNNEFSFSSNKEFSTNRLNVNYYECSDKPTLWLKYLHTLFNDKDVEILQEYIGYCLVPNLLGQKALFIIGKGGEGKSVLGKIITNIFGTSLSSDKIHSLFDGKFGLSNINMKLVIYDDDLMAYQLKDTAIFKTLVTGGNIQYEKKFVNKIELEPYARFIACGNTMLQSMNDESNGFKRRLLILVTKEKDKNRKDDPYLVDKLLEEKDLIFNWALTGLIRLIRNNYKFSYDDEMQSKVDYLVTNDCNRLINDFINNPNYVIFNNECFTSTLDLYNQFLIYCNDNNLDVINENVFYKKLPNICETNNLEKSKSYNEYREKE